MRVLVIGSGGREHALCASIAKSPACVKLFCAPGNPGISEHAICIGIEAMDIDQLVLFAEDQNIELVVIGPEAPLVMGLADRLLKAGIDVFGPTSEAAKLEGSKAFMKDFCLRYSIPTAKYKKFQDAENAKKYINLHHLPIVIKADGLAAGKGVVICQNKRDAYAAIDEILIDKVFGDAGSEIVIEEYLEGEEVSFFVLACGANILPLAAVQDHKAAFDGDKGPNTGGMGAFSPTSIVDKHMANSIMEEIIEPTITGLIMDKNPYTGVLFAGLMITPQGPKLIEYNCRFGDPECQTLLVRLESDVLDMLQATAQGRLNELKLQWSEDSAVTVILATQGYPGDYKKGSQLMGLDQASMLEGVNVFHSGTAKKNDAIIAAGGRVIGVTATASSLKSAQELAYKAVKKIIWPEGYYRKDIGWRELS